MHVIVRAHTKFYNYICTRMTSENVPEYTTRYKTEHAQ